MRRPTTAVFMIASTVAVGMAWFATELGLMALGRDALDPASLLQRSLDLLPWQLGLFVLLGIALAPLARLRAWRRQDSLWWAVGAASFVFLSARVAEGLARQNAHALAVGSVLAVAVGIAMCLAVLHTLGRALPARMRWAWPLAAWSGWTLVFVCFLRRAGPALGNGKVGPDDLLRFFDPQELAIAAGVAVGILLLSSGFRRASVLASCLAALWLAPGARSGEKAAADGAVVERPDVIVILIDTYRFDHLGANVGRPDLTPNLDRLARESIRFTRAFSPSNVTALAMPGVLASLAPRTAERRLPDEADSLAELLRDAGYTTLGISTNPNVSAHFGYQQGFDEFLDPTDQPNFLIVNMLQIVGFALPGPAYNLGVVDAGLYYHPASEVRERALRLLDAAPEPTLLYLHTMDPHGPYLPPRSYLPAGFTAHDFYPYYRFNELSGRGILNSVEFEPHLDNLRQRYEGEVRFSDAELGRLVDELRARGRWEESLVWVLSDHGEAFGEDDYAGHGGQNLTTTLIQVPLLLKPPRSWGIAPRIEAATVSTLDLVPTTLSLLGRSAPPEVFGEDLSGLIRQESAPEDRIVISYATEYQQDSGRTLETYAAIQWPWKLDVRMEKGRRIGSRLFNLEADPEGELEPVSPDPEAAARLELEIATWRAREDDYLFGTTSVPIDERVREQLRNLGYIE